jgi:predicted RNase H-like nuclease
MRKRRYKPEEIVAKLRQVDVLVSQGASMADAIRQIGVSEVTFCRLCVPKTSSALIRRGNRLTLADHDRADPPHLVGLDRPVQIEEPA